MEVLGLKKQNIWRLPAVLNFTLGSMAASFYLLMLLFLMLPAFSITQTDFIRNGILAMAIMAIGLFSLSFEAGNPVRNYLLLMNLRQSWMAREVLFAIVFILFTSADILFPTVIFKSIAGIGAAGFLVSQAFIIYKSRGIVTWNTRPILYLFVLSGVLSGVGLYLMGLSRLEIDQNILYVTQLILILYLIVWSFYLFLYRRNDGDFRSATVSLRNTVSLFISLIIGIIIPIGLIQVALSSGSDGYRIAAGLCLIAGVFIRNHDIIIKAGYFRKLEIQIHKKSLIDVG
jgi:DMSO reductase anchor subunit